MVPPLESVLMREHGINYARARKVAGQARADLGLTQSARWTAQLKDACDRICRDACLPQAADKGAVPSVGNERAQPPFETDLDCGRAELNINAFEISNEEISLADHMQALQSHMDAVLCKCDNNAVAHTPRTIAAAHRLRHLRRLCDEAQLPFSSHDVAQIEQDVMLLAELEIIESNELEVASDAYRWLEPDCAGEGAEDSTTDASSQSSNENIDANDTCRIPAVRRKFREHRSKLMAAARKMRSTKSSL